MSIKWKLREKITALYKYLTNKYKEREELLPGEKANRQCCHKNTFLEI